MKVLSTLGIGALFVSMTACGARVPPPPEVPSPLSQVEHGQALFAEHCARCHGESGEGSQRAPQLVGEGALPVDPPEDSRREERFETAADVLAFVSEYMPPKKGGSLTPYEYAAIVAFALQANGIDLGDDTLTEENAEDWRIGR